MTFEDELQELQDASEATREIRNRWQLTLDSLDDEDVAEAVSRAHGARMGAYRRGAMRRKSPC